MNILIVNQPINNRGDEAAHRALVRTLLQRLPDAKITVLFFWEQKETVDQYVVKSPNVQYVNYRNPHFAWGKFVALGFKYEMPFAWSLHPTTRGLLKYYKECDVVLSAPGGISMGGFQNWTHLLMLYFAKYVQKPIAYYGRSFGPFPTDTKLKKKYKEKSYEILNYVSFLSIRDARTEQLAKDMGLKYVSTVDTAFLEQPRVTLQEELQTVSNERPYVVYVPNELTWHYNYKDRYTHEMVLDYFSRMCNILIDKFEDHNILMLPQTFNYHNYKDDINFFKELKERVGSERVVVLSDRYGSDIQQTLISNAACVVGARYHSVVFAINNVVPFVALSYEHKIEGLLESLGKHDNMIDIVHAMDNNDTIKKSLEEFKEKLNLAKPDKVAQELAKEKAEESMNKFIELVNG